MSSESNKISSFISGNMALATGKKYVQKMAEDGAAREQDEP